MTEAQKYQGVLYKNKKVKTAPNSTPAANNNNNNMAYNAFVEDAGEYEDYDNVASIMQTPLPRAPSPPQPVNVFDFQLNPTPNQSTVALPTTTGPSEAEPTEVNQLVRFEEEPDEYEDIDADMLADDELAFTYGQGPVPEGTAVYQTPAPRSRERKKSEKDSKKDKKRKRLHVSTRDHEMTDAPVLHSGLTGGLKRMTTGPQTYPPSPDYSGSGGEFGETPASPLKKSKHSKHHKSSREETGGIMGSIAAAMMGSSKPASKSKKRKASSASTSTKKRTSSHRTSGSSSKRLEGAKEPKLLGYKDDSRKQDKNGPGTMVLHYDRPVDLFFGMANKYLEKDRGCSVKRALKQFHRERSSADDARPKLLEEKDLFQNLRMRRNDRGEVVLFSV